MNQFLLGVLVGGGIVLVSMLATLLADHLVWGRSRKPWATSNPS